MPQEVELPGDPTKLDQSSSIGVPSPSVCLTGIPDNLAVFGDGHDGDLDVPASAVISLTRDMFWRNLTFVNGFNTVNTNGFVIRISGTLTGPPANGFWAVFRRNGQSATNEVPGSGYDTAGTIGIGGSGYGGYGNDGDGGSGPVGVWASNVQAGSGGAGGSSTLNGTTVAGVAGASAIVSPVGIQPLDIASAMAMRMPSPDNRPIGGGAGGAGGMGIGGGLGGGGGAGAGNVVWVAGQVLNSNHVYIQARGGAGANRAPVPTAGGGGGGGGGIVTVVVRQGSAFPIVDVTGGSGGGGWQSGTGTASNGTNGHDGAVLPFCVSPPS